MKNILLFIGLVFTLLFTACSKRAQCPAYMEPTQGTLSLQDGGDDPDKIRKQSQDLLDSQDYYILVKRDKKTGLVTSKKKVKKGKNYTNKHKGFQTDPRTMKGVK